MTPRRRRPPSLEPIEQASRDELESLQLARLKWNWIHESTARAVATGRSFGSHPVDYGYLWWVTSPSEIITASGALGQWIFVSPRDRLVVTATGNNDNGFQVSPVDFLYSDILTAVR
jgi:CubicO group peptidase (beta-lactamase class C family)